MSKISVPERLGNWFLDENLGSGFSGSIWRATNPYTGQVAAIKIQHVDSDCPTNRYERNFYPSLQGGVGMPTMWAAAVAGIYDYLVIDLLGSSLDQLYRKNEKQVMDLRSVVCIAMQVISRLEFMHSRGILHRDIQLGNCVLGLPPNNHIIYMIDFGFSKRYIDPVTRRHIPDSKVKRDFIGNYWFSSVNVHCRGKVPSRRDDLEALALMLIHVLTPGGLPWTRAGVPRDEYNERRIEREKLNARPEDLCQGLPDVFEEFLRYCRRLKFAEMPDYQRWREEFAELAREKGWADASGHVDDSLVWPPRDEVMVSTMPMHKSPQKPIQSSDLSDLLADLKNMDLNKHQIEGAKKPKRPKHTQDGRPSSHKENVTTQDDSKKGRAGTTSTEPIVVSSDDADSSTPKQPRPTVRHIKASKLNGLTAQVASANTRGALSDLLSQFANVFMWNKVMTREGFDFLDAFKAKLGSLRDGGTDGGALVSPPPSYTTSDPDGSRRTSSRRRTKQSTLNPPLAVIDQHDLIRGFQTARVQGHAQSQPLSNAALAEWIKQFGDVLRNTNTRSVNKHGAAFLTDMAETLDSSINSRTPR